MCIIIVMKKLFVVVVLFLGIAVVAISFSELETIMLTLQKSHLRYFFLAIIIQMIWFVTTARMYQSIFHLLGVHESILALSHIATAANFINVVAPTAGMGGVALFASEARRRGHPAGKVTVAAALFLLLDQAAFLCVLALGLIILTRRNDLGAGGNFSIALSAWHCHYIRFCFIYWISFRRKTGESFGKNSARDQPPCKILSQGGIPERNSRA